MHTNPVGEIIKHHDINCQDCCYADGSQMDLALKSGEHWDDTLSSTEACVASIDNWMNGYCEYAHNEETRKFNGEQYLPATLPNLCSTWGLVNKRADVSVIV